MARARLGPCKRVSQSHLIQIQELLEAKIDDELGIRVRADEPSTRNAMENWATLDPASIVEKRHTGLSAEDRRLA